MSSLIYCYAEYHYAQCRYAECLHTECHNAECRGALSVCKLRSQLFYKNDPKRERKSFFSNLIMCTHEKSDHINICIIKQKLLKKVKKK